MIDKGDLLTIKNSDGSVRARVIVTEVGPWATGPRQHADVVHPRLDRRPRFVT